MIDSKAIDIMQEQISAYSDCMSIEELEVSGKETTRFMFSMFDSSLIRSFKRYRGERCDAKYKSAVNFKRCSFCKREIIEYIYREAR